MIKNISASRCSRSSANYLCFSAVASITYEKCRSQWHFLESKKQVSPWVHAFSYSTRISTSSQLFLSCGSTTSMFYSYFLRRFLKSQNVFLMRSARPRTAFDYAGLIRRYIPSAAKRTSLPKSSRPIPSGFATELIFPRTWMTLPLFCAYSQVSTTILPRDFSRASIYVSSFSNYMASVIKRLASASISMSSST